jgi:hypothetical protein
VVRLLPFLCEMHSQEGSILSLWKSIERKVAALLGGQRVPVTGRQRGSEPDIAHPLFSIEVKHREKLPEWLFDAMSQAVASKKSDDQLPIVVLHSKGQRITESFVVCRLGEFADYYGSNRDNADYIDELEMEVTNMEDRESI